MAKANPTQFRNERLRLIDWTALPTELRGKGWFCLYRNQPNGDRKPRKVPYDAKAPNRCAKINDPATWADWETTQKAFEQYRFDGIHAVCSLPFVFVDLDKCVDNRTISQAAYEIIANLPDTYWETSPSGTGLHGIFCADHVVPNITTLGVEVYSEKHFMSVTGRCINGLGTIAKVSARDFDFLRTKATPKVRPTEGSGYGEVLEGQRSNTLLSIAGTMRRRGLDRESIEHAIRQHNAKHCLPPLDDKKLSSIFKSIDRYEAAGNLLVQENKDVGNADRLLLWGKGNFRYVAAFKRWVVYDSTRWPVDDREQEAIRVEAHAMVRAFLMQAVQEGKRRSLSLQPNA